MKKQIISLVAIAAIALFSNTVMAISIPSHNYANTTATLTVITPLSLYQISDLNFGTIGVGHDGGLLTLSPVDDTREVTSDVHLFPGEEEHVAKYSLSGLLDATFTVTYDNNFKITNSSSQDLTVTPSILIKSNGTVDENTGTLSTVGLDEIKIGGKVELVENTPIGTYTGTFDVTVNYN